MTSLLKQRLIGAIVLISLGIIFIPMLLTGRGNLLETEMESNVPAKPMYEIKAPAVLPLEKQDIEESSLAPIEDKTEKPQAAPTENITGKTATEMPISEEDIESATTAAPGQAETGKTAAATTSPPDATTSESGSAQPTAEPAVKPTVKPAAKPAVAVSPADSQVTKVDTTISKSSLSQKPIVSGWVVQLGSFSVEKNATKLRDQLRKKGYASFVESFQRNGKTSYRVRVGPELTPELAEKLKEKLKAETKLNGLVLAFPSK